MIKLTKIQSEAAAAAGEAMAACDIGAHIATEDAVAGLRRALGDNELPSKELYDAVAKIAKGVYEDKIKPKYERPKFADKTAEQKVKLAKNAANVAFHRAYKAAGYKPRVVKTPKKKSAGNGKLETSKDALVILRAYLDALAAKKDAETLIRLARHVEALPALALQAEAAAAEAAADAEIEAEVKRRLAAARRKRPAADKAKAA